MGLRIKTNVEALFSRRRMEDNTRKMSESMEKLSSGQRINRSADDAAGLAVSERIRAQTRSLEVAKRNASDGISYIQVAEGSLNEITNITVRMRELAAQSASDTLGNRERGFLDKEFQQLRQEVGRIVEATEYNGTKILNAENLEPIRIFVGSSNRGNDVNGDAPTVDEDNNPDILSIDLSDLETLRSTLSSVTDEGLSILPADADGGAADLGSEGTEALFNVLDTALNDISSFRATLGSVQSRLNTTITNAEVSHENLSAAMSRIKDVDFAEETAKFTQAKILSHASMAMMSHANTKPEMVLGLLK